MTRRHPRSTRSHTLLPATSLFRSDGGAEGAAALQRAVRRGRLAKGKALADLRRDDAVRQRLEQALGYRGHLLRGVGVVALVRARQRRRVGLPGADVPAPDRTGSLALADEVTAVGARPQRLGEAVAADGILDPVGAASPTPRLHLPPPVIAATCSGVSV